MKLKMIAFSLIFAGTVAATGYGFYHYGMSQTMNMSGMTSDMPQEHMSHMNMQIKKSEEAASQALKTQINEPANDPSAWGIPEGEAATRRHIEQGLKAGEIDPFTGQKILYYHDPMVPGKKFDSPGKSPFMDMMLVPAYGGSSADSGTVTISPRIQQNLGIRTAQVTEGQINQSISAVGSIAWNEREQVNLQARASGFVEKLYVKATLDPVKKNQALLALYVPDWVAVQEDYLALLSMKGENLAVLREAALARMRQAGMNPQQIRQVQRAGKVQARLVLTAPLNGVVTDLAVREGMTVNLGDNLMQLNGLEKVWSYAEVPESQAPTLYTGQSVTAQTPALPGESFTGSVQALLPEVDPKTRTLKARLEIENPRQRLVPGMYVQMNFEHKSNKPSLLVPTEALIQTGERTLVMIAEANGQFRPVEVTAGVSNNQQTEILKGLKAGEKVVLSGQFLIDSEASLKGIEARSASTDLPNPAPGGSK